MKQTLSRVESEGRPALVTVIGPAGVGKSRLVSELERFAEGLPQIVYWRRGRSLAYGNTSYSAFADAIKAQCEIFEDDAAEVAAKKADTAVRELFGDEGVAPQIRALVGAGDTRGMSREDLFEAWRRFLERMAARYSGCSSSTTSTGPTRLPTSSITWPTACNGSRRATARPELFELRLTWGGGKATPPRST